MSRSAAGGRAAGVGVSGLWESRLVAVIAVANLLTVMISIGFSDGNHGVSGMLNDGFMARVLQLLVRLFIIAIQRGSM